MRNVMSIARRDMLRILRVPAAWVVLAGLIIIPPLYAWFNIAGFWNPYGNTQGIKVTVVNNDRGADSKLTGKLNMGDQIVDQLKTNKKMGWNFADSTEAKRRVESGESYASIVIPPDFSRRVAGILEGKTTKPTLDYYVNEKANALGTRMADSGASTVDKQVNETFVSTVSKAVASTLNKAGDDADARTATATEQTIESLKRAQVTTASIRQSVNDLNARLDQLPGKTQQARTLLASTEQQGQRTSDRLKSASSSMTQTQATLNTFIGQTNTTLDQSSIGISQSSSQTRLAVTAIAAGLTQANGQVGSALATAKSITQNNTALINQLEATNPTDPRVQQTITDLKSENKRLEDSVSSLQDLNSSQNISQLISDITASANGLDKATQGALTNTGAARNSLATGALPQLNNGLNSLASVSATAGAGLTAQNALVSQTNTVLNQLDHTISAMQQALKSTDTGLQSLQNHLSTLTTDLGALNASAALTISGTLERQTGATRLDAQKIANFMLSPTVLNTKEVYPVPTYGSGMAPLFTNLTLWVGAFMLVVLVKLEVDDEGIDSPTPGERYWGRGLVLMLIGVMQAIAAVTGDLIIGVQCRSIPVFYLTAVLASIVYVSIAYALSTAFMHVGKALCIALVIVQIPGSSGLYPIEMMPKFFRSMYPYFPFTYGIRALRETIAGFYRTDWFVDMGKLAIFAVVFSAIGLAFKPHNGGLRRFVDRELAQSDMIVNEPALHIGHEFKLSQALSVLADKKEYHDALQERTTRFARLYPWLMRGGVVFGFVVPVIFAVTFSLATGMKVVALAAWIIWYLIIMIFFVGVELNRDNLARQAELGNLDDEAVRALLRTYDKPRVTRRRNRQKSGAASTARRSGDTGETTARIENGDVAMLREVLVGSAHGSGGANGKTDTMKLSEDETTTKEGLR
jgi:putative membrane protein